MAHPPAANPPISDAMLKPALGAMSVLTLVMTGPQVWTIWVNHQAAGVSVLTWGTYLLSALLWLWHGLLKRDKNIWLPCIGWIAADALVISGAMLYG